MGVTNISYKSRDDENRSIVGITALHLLSLPCKMICGGGCFNVVVAGLYRQHGAVVCLLTVIRMLETRIHGKLWMSHHTGAVLHARKTAIT